MDMKEASAMTEPSGLTDAQGGIERASEAGPSGRAEPRVFQRHSPQSDMAVRWADQLREVTVKAPPAVALRRVPAGSLGRAPALGNPRAGTLHGQKAQDISDLAGLLRSCDRGALDEGAAGGVGRRQQSLPSGRRQGDGRSGCGRRDDVEAGRGPHAAGGVVRTFCRALRSTNQSGVRREPNSA